jgi:Abortive infection alpha
MEIDNKKSLDALGIKPLADAIKTGTQAIVDGASAFLSRICLPAAEEFGFALKDKVHHWRETNKVTMLFKAEQKLKKFSTLEGKHAHPRLVADILNHGSWTEKDSIQNMWAGLLASACTDDGQDESNLIFIKILSQLTALEATILNYSCENSEKEVSKAGWITCREILVIDLEKLQEITGCMDFHRLDRELDHLRSLELIGGSGHGGFSTESTDADITPSSLALQMYVRCQGFIGPPNEYFDINETWEAEDKQS